VDPIDDGVALLAGLVFTNDPPAGWAVGGVDPCGGSWDGVACATGRVISVDLTSQQWAGEYNRPAIGNEGVLGGFELRPSFGNLTALETLILKGTQLSGTIPATLGDLTNLKVLDLTGTHVSGTIPTDIDGLTRLERLIFHLTQLCGTLPPAVGKLDSLNEFWIKNTISLERSRRSSAASPV
jgi:hypothetical protein